jgi:hypothetical protein
MRLQRHRTTPTSCVSSMTKKFTIDSPEAFIRFVKAMSHEPHGKPAPRGVAELYQIMLKNARRHWKEKAAANKAKKNLKKEPGRQQVAFASAPGLLISQASATQGVLRSSCSLRRAATRTLPAEVDASCAGGNATRPKSVTCEHPTQAKIGLEWATALRGGVPE